MEASLANRRDSGAGIPQLELLLGGSDTTTTYWATERADPPPGQAQRPTAETHLPDHDVADDGVDDNGDERTSGFRTYGRSKDAHPELPQVVVGMAVTRTGIPIRVWSWPGDTGDSPLIRQVGLSTRSGPTVMV